MEKSKKSSIMPERLKKHLLNQKARIILLLFLYPYIVGYAPDSTDNSNTVFEFLVGTGRYANITYDCSGKMTSQTRYSFYDYGGSLSHNINGLKFGARGGGYIVNFLDANQYDFNPYYYNYMNNGQYVSIAPIKNHSAQYINPFIGFENKYVDFNFGLVYLSDRNYHTNIYEYLINEDNFQPSWMIRIGNKEKFHFSTQYLSNVPLFSGGGMADAGFGFGNPDKRNLTWIGVSFGPFQNLGLAVKINLQATDKLDLLLRGRVGQIESNFEGGISAGLRYNM